MKIGAGNENFAYGQFRLLFSGGSLRPDLVRDLKVIKLVRVRPIQSVCGFALFISPALIMDSWPYFLIGLLVLVFLYYLRLSELRKKQREIDRKKTELNHEQEIIEQLKRIDQMKDQFLANTSHELRTPLHGMIGLAESMLEEVKDPKHLENLSMIISSGKRLGHLVDDILDFSKLKNYDIQLVRKSLDLRALVDVVLKNNLPLIKGKNMELLNEVDIHLPFVVADENRLQQVLFNLIGNSIKFTETGYVKVSTREMGEEVQIMVSDTGIGIPDDKKEVIFQEFEQGDGSTFKVFAGTGLGLSISKRLIEMHGGKMWVESTVGIGSTFYFTLPLDRQMHHPVQSQTGITPSITNYPVVASSQIQHQKTAIRILVVDDEPVNQQVLRNHLNPLGFQVTTAMNGEQAIEAIASGQAFDLVLLDVMMPRMSGYQVCEKIREKYLPSELPVIMVTANGQLQGVVEGLTVGANDYLAKPFHKEELLARIKTQLDLNRIFRVTGRFVPLEFLKAIDKDRITDVNLGDFKEQKVTVMFSDIREYTTLAEQMTPEENFRFVNALNGRMGPIILRHQGFINQYLGDSIMAIFPRHPGNAVRAAVEMHLQLIEYNEHRISKGRKILKIGVGLHTGSLIMGIIGDTHRMDAATISDSVNTASRIESLSKYFGTSILISEDTYDEIDDRRNLQFRYLGQVVMKGKKEPVGLYECFSGDSPRIRDQKLQSLAQFDQGLKHYYAREFGEASEFFDAALQICPKDQVSALFLEKARNLMIEGVREDWTGVEVMSFK